MKDFAQAVKSTGAFFYEYSARIAENGVSLGELDELDDFLDSFKQAVQDHRELIEKALEDAGGADCKGDLNKAQKVYLQELDVSDVKPGWNQRKV